MNSFASNGECGLKQGGGRWVLTVRKNSFASNGECGLKPVIIDLMWRYAVIIHSPAMANVD